MRGSDGLTVALTAKSRRSLLMLVLASLLALLPLPANQAQGASTTPRLDWGAKTPMPTARDGLGLAAAPDGLLYAIGGNEAASSAALTTVEAYDPAANRWDARAPMPTARGYFGLALATNGKLYAAGGSNGATLGIVEEYDPTANAWRARAPLHQPRVYLALAAAPNGKVYAVGGLDTGGTVVGTVEEYDPGTNVWTAKAPMPTARFGVKLAAAPNGRLYAVGGYGDTTSFNAVEAYDPSTDVWQARAPMPTARGDLGLAAAANGKLYAVGGFSGSARHEVEEYDPAADIWTARTSMPTARLGLGLATAPNGRLYAVGGRAGGNTFATVEEYDPRATTWAGIRTPPLPQARMFPATAVAGGILFVFGGANGISPSRSVFQYDPSLNAWRQLADMPTAREGAVAVTAQNGKMYVVGGLGMDPTCPGGTCTAVEELTPPSGVSGGGTWRGAADGISQLPAGRQFLAMALGVNGKLYATGGSDGSVSRAETYEYDPATNSAWQPMASMHTPRAGLGLAQASDRKLYAVGGVQGTTALTTVERFVLPSAGSPQGSWEGPAAIAPLPAARVFGGLIGLPNGNLLEAGGASVDSSTTGFFVPQSDVFEYDAATNAWAFLAPVPTARYGHGLALRGVRQVFVSGGTDGNAQIASVVEGDRDELPSVSAGGPYSASGGGAVQLTATGSDPDGGSLSYAWDLDGSLLYATPGQSVTFSEVGQPAGTQTVRVRALNAFGGYALASSTVTVTTVCAPRPDVGVSTTRAGAGRLQAVIRAQTSPGTPANSLQRIAITRIDNAVVQLNGSPVTVGASIPLQAGTSQVTLQIERLSPAAGSTVSFVAIDACGEWRSFVGGGPTAF